MKIGIYPGSFDPITNGHKDVIKRACLIFDRLIIAVALDNNKSPLFSIEQRLAMVEQEIAEYGKDGAIIEAKAFSGLLVKFARDNGADIIVRGLRAISDFEYEFQMSHMNYKLAPDIQTIFLPASDSTQFISSRFVKEIARLGGDISNFVSPNIATQLKSCF